MVKCFDFRGEVIDFEVQDQYPSNPDGDFKYIKLIYKDGRVVVIRGGDHGNEDPWVWVDDGL